MLLCLINVGKPYTINKRLVHLTAKADLSFFQELKLPRLFGDPKVEVGENLLKLEQ